MAATKDYVINTTGRRKLALSKKEDGTYQMKVMLGEKALATLPITAKEWERLASFAEGLKRK